MSSLAIFLTELTLSIGFSLTVIALLRRPLRNVLIESCGTNTRAEFWMVFTQLMLIAAPLLPVVFLSAAGSNATPEALIVIKDGLFRILLGIFFALAMIGRVIWKTINADAVPAAIPEVDGASESEAAS